MANLDYEKFDEKYGDEIRAVAVGNPEADWGVARDMLIAACKEGYDGRYGDVPEGLNIEEFNADLKEVPTK